MATYQILLDGSDITNKTTSISIERELNSGIVGFSLETFNIVGVKLFKNIIIKRNGSTFVTGMIIDQTDRADTTNKRIFTSYTCQDFGYLLNKRIVLGKYENQTITYIIKDLLSKKATELTQTYVDNNTTKTSADFVYSPLTDALEYLFDIAIGWNYYIDGRNGFHFFKGSESTFGTTITGLNIDLEGLTINYDGVDTYNRVWIIGRKQPSSVMTEIPYTMNGTQTDFGALPYEPSDLKVYFTPTGLPEYQLELVEEGQDSDGKDGTYNVAKRTINLTPAKTGSLRVTFYPMRQVVEYFENPTSLASYPLLEKAVTNVDIIDRLEARRYGIAEVNTVSKILKTISFQSSKLLDIEIGQKLVFNINSEAWVITGNYLVKKVTRNITPDFENISVECEEIA
jgi:hypothetical protein